MKRVDKMNDLISIIVPIYNVEKYLKRCIDSIINQTYTNLEIILVNDGSTDNSKAICDKYKNLDERVKLIDKENGGLSDARNVGINYATGKYIGFIDADDYIDSRMYQILYNNIKNTNSDLSICSYIKIKENEIRNIDFFNDIKIFNKEDALYELLNDNLIDNYAWNKLYNKELFNQVKYPYGKKFEDIGTTYKIIDKTKSVVVTNYCGYYYVNRENSITNNLSHNMIQDYIQMVTEMLFFYKDNINKAEIRYTIHFHNLCIKSHNRDLYQSDILLKYYKNCKKILKENKLDIYIKNYDFKKKLMAIILFMNRNFAYLLFSLVSR